MIGHRPRSADIKAAANDETSVAVQQLEESGRPRLRNRKKAKKNLSLQTLEVRNLKVESSKTSKL